MDDKKSLELKRIQSFSQGEIIREHAISPADSYENQIQDAIEAIGMGRYQWQLMVSCGFGFVVDQVCTDQ